MTTPTVAGAPVHAAMASPSAAPPAASVESELKRVQDDIASTRRNLDAVELTHDRQLKSSSEIVTRCNHLADTLQPLYTSEARVLKMNNLARYSGLAGSCMLGLGPGLLSISPIAAMVVTLVDMAVIGGAILTCEASKRKLRALQPQIISLTQQYNSLAQSLQATQQQAASSRAEIDRLQTTLKGLRSKEDVMLMARGVNQPPHPAEKVQTQDDAIIIGKLRIPRRSPAAEAKNPIPR